MASGFYEYDFILVVFISSVIMIGSLFVEAGPASSGTIYPPLSALPQAIPSGWDDLWLVSMAILLHPL
jgi:cytochrome c oxidase subunit 1